VEEESRVGLQPAEQAQQEPNAQTELNVLHGVLAALQQLTNDDERERVLQTAAAFFRISLGSHYTSSVSRASSLNYSLILLAKEERML